MKSILQSNYPASPASSYSPEPVLTDADLIDIQMTAWHEQRQRDAIQAATMRPRVPLSNAALQAANAEARRLGKPLTQKQFEEVISRFKG